MKTEEEKIKEEAEAFNGSLPDDENKSTSEFMELAYLAGYQSSQSLMESNTKEIESEIQRYDGGCASSQLEAIQNQYYVKGMKKALELINKK